MGTDMYRLKEGFKTEWGRVVPGLSSLVKYFVNESLMKD
jgi:hypothetical protein